MLYIGYTMYSNIEVYQSPVTGKKFVLLVTKEK